MILLEGEQRCEFCGRRLSAPAVPPPAARAGRPRAAFEALKAIGLACLVAGAFLYVSRHGGEPDATTKPPAGLDLKRQAVAACEDGIRRQVRAPFRVIAFRTALVAEEQGIFAVSGTVELQSVAGELRLRRYSCRLRREARSGVVLEEGRLEEVAPRRHDGRAPM